VHAFLNVCAHRWGPVAPEGYGNCSRFTCPFHGWTYTVDGKLIGITDRAKFGDIDRAKHGLQELPCEERHGLIFVCLTADRALDLDSYYGALLEEYAYAGLNDWTFFGSRVVEGANWKLTFNNFLETYHFATLHSNTVAVEMVPNVNHYEGFGPNMRTSLVNRSIRKLREAPRERWSEHEGQEFGFIRIFFPNVTGYLGPERNVSLFTQTFPGPTPDKCRIVCLYLRKSPAKDRAEREAIEK
jgi:phenylpropionate dioxygenase-like ring-hydroxylating dioxygenase large terminal subunit